MCGIAGYWTCGNALRGMYGKKVLKNMAMQIRHRGPDSEGYWTDDRAGIGLAHRRLSIVDLTHAGSQPMVSDSGRYIISFNGEVYNYRELRAQLESGNRAPNWRGHSDTEVLLACIEAWGIETTLKRCLGMFAFAVWDRGRQVLILARDRIGEKPLYYGHVSNIVIFGSELKALKVVPEFDSLIDRGAALLLLKYNYIPSPFSIYKGVFKLPPGTWIEFTAPSELLTTPRQYWSYSNVVEEGERKPLQLTQSEAAEHLDELLSKVVRSQMVADVEVGAWLSGGIDSSTVVALAQAQAERPIRTFSIGFDDKWFDESSHARMVAHHLGTNHTEVRLSQRDVLEIIPGLAQIFDEPFADPSQLPTILLSRITRERVKVAVSGDGGDEIFGGYNRYLLGPQLWRMVSPMPPLLRHLFGLLLEGTPAQVIRYLESGFRTFGVSPALSMKLPSIGRKLKQVRSMDDLYVELMSEWEGNSPVEEELPVTLLRDRNAWPKLFSPVTKMMAVDALTYLPDDVMLKVDRSSMAASLEIRAPFLDARVVEFASKLPLEMKISRGLGKRVLRQVLYRYVPEALVERPKQGFGIPLDNWLRGELRDWAEDLLSEARLRAEGFFDPVLIRRAWKAHLACQQQFGNRLWSVLMFQSWLAAQHTHETQPSLNDQVTKLPGTFAEAHPCVWSGL